MEKLKLLPNELGNGRFVHPAAWSALTAVNDTD